MTDLAAQLDAILDRDVGAGRVVGAVLLVSQAGRPVYARAAGWADREAGRAMRADTVFRLASVTKPLVSATALAMAEAGLLGLDDPVTRFLPDFRPALADGTRPRIGLRHLLTHTAGLTYGFLHPEGHGYHRAGISDGLDRPGRRLADNLALIAQQPLAFAPGTAWMYSVATDVLGAVLAVAGDAELPDLVARHVAGPLGLRDTGFAPPGGDRLARAYADGPRVKGRPRPAAEPMGDTHAVAYGEGAIRFAPDRGLDAASFASGGAGMFGTAPELMTFLEAVRTRDPRLARPETLDGLMRDAIPGIAPAGRGPGWGFSLGGALLRDPRLAETPQSPGTWAWGGVYGHSWFVDPARQVTALCLTNTAIAGMDGPFPTRIRDAICAAL